MYILKTSIFQIRLLHDKIWKRGSKRKIIAPTKLKKAPKLILELIVICEISPKIRHTEFQ